MPIRSRASPSTTRSAKRSTRCRWCTARSRRKFSPGSAALCVREARQRGERGGSALVDQVAEPEEEHRAERVFDSWVHGRRAAGLSPPLAVTADPISERRRSEEHTSELQSRLHLVCRLLLEK